MDNVNTSKRVLSPDELGILFLIIAVVFGAWFRLFPVISAGFPINDGGLFYVMIQSIRDNLYHLPEFIEFNGLTIPFTYPPFAFFLAGFITDAFNLDLISTMRWLPAIVLVFTIPLFHYLAFILLKSQFKAGIASVFYATMSRSVAWYIMGGGVTRSPGLFFLILSAITYYLLFTKKEVHHLVFSIIASTFACLTHPEAALHTMIIAILFWCFYGRNKVGIIKSVFTAIGTLLFTSPWWITVIARHGISPFISAVQTGFNDFTSIIMPLFPLEFGIFLPIITSFAMIGISKCMASKEYLLPLMYILPFVAEPRNAANVAIIPLALLSSVALTEVLFPTFSLIEGKARNLIFVSPLQSRAEKFFLTYCVVYLILGMVYAGGEYSNNRISPASREAFKWIKTNTDPEAVFLILTGKNGLEDYSNEWFPVLTQRNSITTIQGSEWIEAGVFEQKKRINTIIQNCTGNINVIECIEDAALQEKFKYNYVVFINQAGQERLGESPHLWLDDNYTIVYFSNEVIVIKKSDLRN